MTSQQYAFDFEDAELGKLEAAFWAFHEAHPEVLDLLVQFALDARMKRGPEAKLGMKALFERVRWELWIEGLDDKEPPKLNNNHTAFYARLIMDENPRLAGIFSLRRQRLQATIGPENEGLPDPGQIIGP